MGVSTPRSGRRDTESISLYLCYIIDGFTMADEEELHCRMTIIDRGKRKVIMANMCGESGNG